MAFRASVGSISYRFDSLRELLAKASPRRSGDELAGLAASGEAERVAAQIALADVPLKAFLEDSVIPPEIDDVTRLILNTHDKGAFKGISTLTVGDFREYLLQEEEPTPIRPGVTPEMAAAVSKLMRNGELILAAQKLPVITRFRSTIGLPGRFSTRLQPNHPIDDPRGVLASTITGLLFGCGDAVIGINPAGDSVATTRELLHLLDDVRTRLEIPTQTCVLAHVTTQIKAMEEGAPIDLVFQSIGGTEATNRSFGVTLEMLKEASEASQSLKRGTIGSQTMYFETGQGSSLSANAHHGIDQQTLECRAYGVARAFDPFLVNTVVGFIGPEYLYDGKQILRAGLEDHFCGKLLGLPMGVDVCYTNHAEADPDDMDSLLMLLGMAGVNYVMAVPGGDDVMLGYQSTSFHDALTARKALNKRPAPEFEAWLRRQGLIDAKGEMQLPAPNHPALRVLEAAL